MKKKLLVTASTFPRWEKDTEPRFVYDLARELTRYYNVTVLAPAAQGALDYEVMDGVEVIRYHYFPIHRFETLCYPGAIMQRVKAKKIRLLLIPFLCLSLYYHLLKLLPKFDVVHAHWIIPQGVVQSLFRKPFIVTGHGSDVFSFNRGIFGTMKRRCLKKARFVTVVSPYLKQEVLKLCNTAKLELIPMGCNLKNFGKKYKVKNYFGQGEKKVILFVGRLVEAKGLIYLLEAMKNLDAVLAIAGEGPQREQLEKYAGSMEDKVLFLGPRTHEELKIIYASADIFVSPSVTTSIGSKEGLGLVLLEAMASGLPVVASNSGGITSIVEDKVNGLLCEEKNAEQLAAKIELLLKDDELCVRLSQKGAETVKAFDYETIGKKYHEILEKSIVSRGR